MHGFASPLRARRASVTAFARILERTLGSLAILALALSGASLAHSAASSNAASGTADAIAKASTGAHRNEANIARNAARHPVETLTFFGLEPEMTVIEALPGGGLWYGEILAPILRDRGQYIVADYDISLPDQPEYRTRGRATMLERFGKEADVFGHPKIVKLSAPESIDLGPPGTADMVLTFRNTHGWIRDGAAEQVYAAFFEVLKPGGVLGVVQHRAGPKTDTTAFTGYVSEDRVIELATRAGFVLEARSEINANPKDTADYPDGVWTLPPTLTLKDKDREKYLAIGESDRMTLRFRKP
jgi:predicted methyltransferase